MIRHNAPMSRPRIPVHLAAMTVLSLLASACTDLRYLAHVAHGQLALARAREPIERVIAAPAIDAKLAARLRLAQDARHFASTWLGLPANASYTSYVDLHRPYVVWNVFAAPRYAVDAVLHCFPIAGCVPYRGYFDETLAKEEAARQRAAGNDVYVGGVSAYSTLGWFADPILSSMLRWDDDELAGTIFHELAHQLIYVKNDTAFNESFASFVQREGLRQWRAARGMPPLDDANQRRNDEFVRLVLDLRERLRALYASGLDAEKMEAAKQREFAEFRARYRQWRDTQSGERDASGHARESDGAERARNAFVESKLNNASLLPFDLYDQWVPAFAALFREAGGDWKRFYTRVRALAHEPKAQREQALQRAMRPERAP